MSFRIEGATGSWEIVCGLEVHAQVATASKLFSGASTAFGGESVEDTHDVIGVDRPVDFDR